MSTTIGGSSPAITFPDGTTQTTAATALPSQTGNSGKYLTTDGTNTSWGTIASGLPGVLGQVFTSNGTFTIPSGVTAVKVTVVGGGGGGSYYNGSGAGGGAAIKYLSGLTPGGTLSVTVGSGGARTTTNVTAGTGGASSVASGTQSISTITANGGGGGLNSAGGQLGGIGGTASGGDINIQGQSGLSGQNTLGSSIAYTASGSSLLGMGAMVSASGDNAPTGYGAGGPAAVANCYGTSTSKAGTAGIVIFEW